MYWYFLRFIVRRCHAKIAERMLNGDKIWTRHPIAVLHDWQPPEDASAFPPEEFPVHHQILEATLSVYGLNPVGHQGERAQYHFGTDNAKAWAQVACVLYEMLEKRLLTPYYVGHLPRATMEPDSIAVVADYLDTFAVLLELPPMQAILMHRSFTSLLQPRHPTTYTTPHVNGAFLLSCRARAI